MEIGLKHLSVRRRDCDDKDEICSLEDKDHCSYHTCIEDDDDSVSNCIANFVVLIHQTHLISRFLFPLDL